MVATMLEVGVADLTTAYLPVSQEAAWQRASAILARHNYLPSGEGAEGDVSAEDEVDPEFEALCRAAVAHWPQQWGKERRHPRTT